MSRANKTRFHLPDGAAQEARDAEWARAGDRSPEAPEAPRWLFEFDATVVPSAVTDTTNRALVRAILPRRDPDVEPTGHFFKAAP